MMKNYKYLPMWYDADSSTKIGRHTSARRHKEELPTYDYRLCPICEEDADMLLFNTVWDIVTHSFFHTFYEDAIILDGKTDIHRDDCNWSKPYLLFPADCPNVKWQEQEMELPFLVGSFHISGFLAGEGGFVEDDDYYHFDTYYTPEWSYANGEPEIAYREHSRQTDDPMPCVDYDGVTMLPVVNEMIEFLASVGHSVEIWSQRFKTVKGMLAARSNELHILHQAGLYDIGSLWGLLQNIGNNESIVMPLRRRIERELHRYAMMTVNTLHWMSEWERPPINRSPMASREKPSAQPKLATGRSDIRDILGNYWQNDIGLMEKAFIWSASERSQLDDAYNAGTNGRAPFCDDLSNYVILLRSMVKKRLWEMSRNENDPTLREWLLQQSR